MEKTFTENRLSRTPALMRCLLSTNIIENPKGSLRRVIGRLCRRSDPQLVPRWAMAAFLQAAKGLRRINSCRDLWAMGVALGREQSGMQIDAQPKAA